MSSPAIYLVWDHQSILYDMQGTYSSSSLFSWSLSIHRYNSLNNPSHMHTHTHGTYNIHRGIDSIGFGGPKAVQLLTHSGRSWIIWKGNILVNTNCLLFIMYMCTCLKKPCKIEYIMYIRCVIHVYRYILYLHMCVTAECLPVYTWTVMYTHSVHVYMHVQSCIFTYNILV